MSSGIVIFDIVEVEDEKGAAPFKLIRSNPTSFSVWAASNNGILDLLDNRSDRFQKLGISIILH